EALLALEQHAARDVQEPLAVAKERRDEARPASEKLRKLVVPLGDDSAAVRRATARARSAEQRRVTRGRPRDPLANERLRAKWRAVCDARPRLLGRHVDRH